MVRFPSYAARVLAFAFSLLVAVASAPAQETGGQELAPEAEQAAQNAVDALEDLRQQVREAEEKEVEIQERFRRGNNYFLRRDFENAEKEYLAIVEMSDDYAAPFLNLGTIYEIRTDYLRSIGAYRRAAQVDPKSAEPAFGLGDVFLKMGKYGLAVENYERGLARDPANTLTKSRLQFARLVSQRDGVLSAPLIREKLGGAPQSRSPAMPAQSARVTLRQIRFEPERARFDFGSAHTKEQLAELAKALATFTGEGKTNFRIESHTDEGGDDAANRVLSANRARRIRDFLAANTGLAKRDFEVAGLGSAQPAVRDAGPDTVDLNRRIVVAVLEPMDPQTPRDLDLKIRVDYVDRGGRKVTVGPDTKLPHGVKYQLRFTPAQEGYVYVLHEDDKGRLTCLFPKTGTGATQQAETAPAAGTHVLPNPNRFFQAPRTSSKWVIRFYVAERKLEGLEQVVAQATEAGQIAERGALPLPVLRAELGAALSPGLVESLPSPVEEVVLRTGE